MMAEFEDSNGDLPIVEQMKLSERLRQAKKQRAMQLKSYEQREKKFAKDDAMGSKRFGKKGKKMSNGEMLERMNERRVKLRFSDSILLMDAVSRKDLDEVKKLLAAGISPNIPGIDGLTALHQSCIDNAVDMVHLLVESGADVNARDVESWTPMHAAATCGHLILCRYLCEHGADLLAMNTDGNMPYDLCEDVATLDYIEAEMTRQGVTQELIDQTRLTNENKMLAELQQLWANGGDLEYRGANGETPLHIAACCGYTRVVEYLVSRHISLDVVDNDSWQAIHCAACWSQPLVIEVLLMNGVDPDSKTCNGETCLDLCEDLDIKQQILEIMDAVKNKRPQPVRENSHGQLSRRTSSARRSSIVSPASIAWQRRSSLHERRDSISLREIREEAQRLRESILLGQSDEDDEELNGFASSPVPSPESGISDYGAGGDRKDIVNNRLSSSSNKVLIPLQKASSCPPVCSTSSPGNLAIRPSLDPNPRPPVTVTKSIIKKTSVNGDVAMSLQSAVDSNNELGSRLSPTLPADKLVANRGHSSEVAEPKEHRRKLCCAIV